MEVCTSATSSDEKYIIKTEKGQDSTCNFISGDFLH